MASDDNRRADDISVELNPLPPIPDRPADSASKGEWVDYVVALGGDRGYAEDQTRADLQELAARFGG
jgi:hypothetical protein